VAGRSTRSLDGTPDMATSFFENTVYVVVKRNQFRVRHIESSTEAAFEAQPPFSTPRLLIGQFQAAESLLKRAVKQMAKSGFLSVSPQVVIHPLEMLDGGLSEVEERVLREVAMGAGASKVVVWVGPQLTDAEVKAKAKE
jgi:rod shape-determining protein MreB and related proteins